VVASDLWLRLACIIRIMVDGWTVLDRTLDVIELAGIGYFFYLNRDLLLQRSRPPHSVTVQGSVNISMKPATLSAEGVHLERVESETPGGDAALSALSEFFYWWMQVR
jgi:hypothetical protein